MSEILRQNLLDDIINRKGDPGTFFDKGTITLERKHWEKQWRLSQITVMEARTGMKIANATTLPFPWRDFKSGLRKLTKKTLPRGGSSKNPKGSRFYLTNFQESNTRCSIDFRRTLKTVNGQPYNRHIGETNLEEQAKGAIKRYTVNFFKVKLKKDKKIQKAVIDKLFKGSKKGQEFEHGEVGRQEPEFGDFVSIEDAKSYETQRRRDYKAFLDGKNTNERRVSGIGGTVSGAKGTKIEQVILKAICDSMAVSADVTNSELYHSFHEAVIVKWKELFQINSAVNSHSTEEELMDTMLMQGTMVPDILKNNDGEFDKAIRDHFEDFLADDKQFVKDVQRLMGLSLKKAQDLWADSPSFIDRSSLHAKKLMIQRLFPKHKTNPNMTYKLNKNLFKSLNSAKKGKMTKSSPGRVKRQKSKGKTGRLPLPVTSASGRARKARGTLATKRAQSPTALRNLINSMLPQVVAMKMHEPKLRFRTGRFANSARVTQVTIGKRGGLKADYTYQRDPYETFEPGNKMGSVQRDPRRIIGASVREIVADQMQGKFIQVRRV